MPDLTLRFRLLALPDLPLLQHVGRASYEPYYPHLWKPGGLDWYMERCFGEAALRADFADPNVAYFLVTAPAADGQPVGFLKLVLQKPLPSGALASALYLEKVYLMPDYFGRGIGQRLIHFAEEKARALGREAIWLMVMKSGPRHVYERAGFRLVGEMPIDFDLMLEHERGLWVMSKNLD